MELESVERYPNFRVLKSAVPDLTDLSLVQEGPSTSLLFVPDLRGENSCL